MRHKPCIKPDKPMSGHASQWWIREHGYSFFMCDDCRKILGERAAAEVARLMRTKVYPTMRRV